MNQRLSFTFLLVLIILVIFTSVPSTAYEIVDDQAKSSSSLSTNGECPYPLISLKSTGLLSTNTSFCVNGCCLSCPIANNFYKENQIDLIFHVLSVVRVISFICVLIIVVSYIVLPNKREHPALTVLCFNISLLIFTGVTFFYVGNIRRIQCADLINQATMKNNALCGIQGNIIYDTLFSYNINNLYSRIYMYYIYRNCRSVFNVSPHIMVFPFNFASSLSNCMEIKYHSKISSNVTNISDNFVGHLYNIAICDGKNFIWFWCRLFGLTRF